VFWELVPLAPIGILKQSLEESLSITTGRRDLAIATHARKMHKDLFVVVHPEVLDND
jgi:hypothetical protein